MIEHYVTVIFQEHDSVVVEEVTISVNLSCENFRKSVSRVLGLCIAMFPIYLHAQILCTGYKNESRTVLKKLFKKKTVSFYRLVMHPVPTIPAAVCRLSVYKLYA